MSDPVLFHITLLSDSIFWRLYADEVRFADPAEMAGQLGMGYPDYVNQDKLGDYLLYTVFEVILLKDREYVHMLYNQDQEKIEIALENREF